MYNIVCQKNDTTFAYSIQVIKSTIIIMTTTTLPNNLFNMVV